MSRHHGRIAGRRGTLVYTDLGSTNGSRVNGVPVTEVVLGVGDRIEVGDTVARGRGRRGAPTDGRLPPRRCGPSGSCSSACSTCSCSRVVRALLRDLRAAAREPADRPGPAGRRSPRRAASRPPGRSFALDAITPLGRDVNNAIVVDDPFASAEHAVLTFRGRAWYVEDLGCTNGTFVNGRRSTGVAPLGFGDELQIGQVRLRLERARSRERR